MVLKFLFLLLLVTMSSSSPSGSERYTRQALTFGKQGSEAIAKSPTIHIINNSGDGSDGSGDDDDGGNACNYNSYNRAADECFKCLVLSGVRRIKCYNTKGSTMRGPFNVHNPDVDVVDVSPSASSSATFSLESDSDIAVVFGSHSPSIESLVRSRSGSYVHVGLKGGKGCLTTSVDCITTDGDGVKVKDVHVENVGGGYSGEITMNLGWKTRLFSSETTGRKGARSLRLLRF